MRSLENKTIGFAITASFCTFSKILAPMQELVDAGANVIPIMSFNASGTDTRFFMAKDFKEKVLSICNNPIIDTITAAEPIGPRALLDALVVAPCTGNTLGKLAGGITDTPVTMACKSHLRNNRPVLIAVSTNDALSGSAINIGKLLNTKGYYFVPFVQDDSVNKPCSLVANMSLILPSLEKALVKEQIQPILGRFESFT